MLDRRRSLVSLKSQPEELAIIAIYAIAGVISLALLFLIYSWATG